MATKGLHGKTKVPHLLDYINKVEGLTKDRTRLKCSNKRDKMKGIQERIKRETLDRLREYEARRQAKRREYERKSINDIIEGLLEEVHRKND